MGRGKWSWSAFLRQPFSNFVTHVLFPLYLAWYGKNLRYFPETWHLISQWFLVQFWLTPTISMGVFILWVYQYLRTFTTLFEGNCAWWRHRMHGDWECRCLFEINKDVTQRWPVAVYICTNNNTHEGQMKFQVGWQVCNHHPFHAFS